MVMRWLACIGSCVMHVACSTGATSMPDATEVDAAVGGLAIELVAKGGVPQMPELDVEVITVVLGATSIRAIGDAAPGDVRTTRPNYKFSWPGDNTNPVPLLFSEAPPGLYSTVELRVSQPEPAVSALKITGRTRRNGDLVPFEIDSTSTNVAVAVTIETVLAPRQLAVASIAVDVAELVDDVDWDMVPLTGDGRLYITDGDGEMSNVVSALATAFTAR